MGGYGSGRHFYNVRTKVEDCIVLNGYQFLPKIIRAFKECRQTGNVFWSKGGIKYSSISYLYNGSTLTLSYIKNKTEDIEYPLSLATNEQPNGGIRYWFICPAAGCGKRAAKLYKPTGAKYFLCRSCYNLTYESCNESHRYTALFRLIGCSGAREANKIFGLQSGF